MISKNYGLRVQMIRKKYCSRKNYGWSNHDSTELYLLLKRIIDIKGLSSYPRSHTNVIHCG